MSAADILLGRGIITLDSNDVGNCSSLRVRHEIQYIGIARWDGNPIGGIAEGARRTRVYIDFTLHELSASNRALILDLAGDPDELSFNWTGKNKMSADCSASSWSLTVPSLVLLPVPILGIISAGLEDSRLDLSGEALRADGATSWYTFSAS